MPSPTDVVSVERLIPAPPEAIFALLADPSRHKDIDGSGSVIALKGESQRLGLGSQFGMSMKAGFSYSMVSTVVEFEEDRRIAWQTYGSSRVGRRTGGRIWRYELEPAEGGTLVRESWDISQETRITKALISKGAKRTGASMAATLARIEELLAP